MSARRCRMAAWSAAALLAILCAAQPARAQAFVPDKGEGAVSVLFQESYVTKHLLPTNSYDVGHIRSVSALVDFGIGLGRRTAVNVAVPYLALRYTGNRPHNMLPGEEVYHPAFVFQDDGAFHGAVQDLRVDFRYNATRRGLVVTPFVAVGGPRHEYEVFAQSAVGRNLREVQVGTLVARLLDPVIPRAFIQGRYAYSVAEQAAGISPKRSNMALEAGYFIKPSLRAFFLTTAQFTHNGIDFPEPPAVPRLVLGSEQFVHHDRVARYEEFNLGFGAAFDLTASVGVFGSFMKTMTGRNIHVLDRMVTAGVSFGFGWKAGAGSLKQAAATAEADRARAEADALLKCVCMKNE